MALADVVVVAAVANILILLAVIPVWAFAITVRIYRQAPNAPATRERMAIGIVRLLLGIGLALVGLQFDLQEFAHRSLYPGAVSIGIGVVILLGIDLPALLFVIRYYRK